MTRKFAAPGGAHVRNWGRTMRKTHGVSTMSVAFTVLALFATYPAIARPVIHTPPPARLQPLQLTHPFTLVYSSVVQSISNKRPVYEKLRMTLSYDGKNLLYTSENLETRLTHIYLYNGKETYVMDRNSRKTEVDPGLDVSRLYLYQGKPTYPADEVYRLSEIDPGFDFSRLWYCPLPGVGIPKMPFFTIGIADMMLPKLIEMAAGNVNSEPKFVDPALYRTPERTRDYGFYSSADRDAHIRESGITSGIGSVVTVPSDGVPKVLWFDSFAEIGKPYLGHLWEFSRHERFQGLWLARKIRMRWCINGDTNPIISATYDLQSAKSQPLEPRAYDPTTYLPEHANITDFTGPSSRAFLYEPGNGPLELQRQKGQDIEKAPAPNVN